MTTIKRDTNVDLFNAAVRLAREAGHLEKMDAILDYELADDYHRVELTNYRFDSVFVAGFGGSEGIYIDAYIMGEYAEDMKNKPMRVKLGTIKTLEDDLEAMKVMGEACGALTYFANKYVNAEINRYTPVKELESMERQRAEWAKKGYFVEVQNNDEK